MARDLHKLRNIGIIAHIDAGKTTLTERMLYYSGAIHRMGDVDKGTTTTDSDEEEQQRGITIYSAAVTFQWKDISINLIDTPGHVDFTAEVERSLRVLDGGVVVFSAREGVEAQSETVWRQADKYRVPRIAFINKMDREGADFTGTVNEMRERLGARCAIVQIPVGNGPAHLADPFRGIIDLIRMRLLSFDLETQGSKVTDRELPDDLRDQAELERAVLLETLSDFSDEVMDLVLSEQPVPEDLLRRVIREATIARFITPVFCGTALHYIGVQPLLDAVMQYLPSPADVPPVEGVNPKHGDKVERRGPDPEEPFCGLVFKIEAGRYGELHFVRVYSGHLKANSRTFNPGKDKKENVAQMWRIQADRREKQVDDVEAGDIVGIIGMRHSVTGDTICDPKHPVLLESITFPETVVSMAIEPETSADRKKLADTLEMLKRQDPTFRAQLNEDTGQTLISGMGELHLEIIKHRLLRDFNLNVKVHKPRVSYRETIKGTARVTGESHRQIAGEAHVAEVTISIAPDEEGTGKPRVFRGTALSELPHDLVAAAEQALSERSEGGGWFGFPLIDAKITLENCGPAEGWDDIAIHIAASNAFQEGLQQAGTKILEPIMKLDITTPEENLGDFIADLQQRHGVVTHTHTRGTNAIIEAECPLANLFGYSSAMRSLSQGRASCSMEPSKYAPAPPEVQKSFL